MFSAQSTSHDVCTEYNDDFVEESSASKASVLLVRLAMLDEAFERKQA